jgi:hypothetical protein
MAKVLKLDDIMAMATYVMGRGSEVLRFLSAFHWLKLWGGQVESFV